MSDRLRAPILFDEGSSIDSYVALVDWIRGPLREVFQHRHALIATGSAHALGITIDETIGVDLPQSYVRGLRNDTGHIDSPVLLHWNIFRETQFFRADEMSLDAQWSANFRKHKLENGLLDVCGEGTWSSLTFLCLYNLPQPSTHLKAAFRAIAVRPVHRAVQRLYESKRSAAQQQPAIPLTPAELNVLRWLKEGKNTEEIALILGKSKLTVKTQIHNILTKCGASNRLELVQRLNSGFVKFHELS